MTSQTITTHVSPTVAQTLIERAGIEPQIVIDRKGRESVKWIVPEEARFLIGDHAFTWATDEALMWAMTIIASVNEPDLLVWR